MKILYATTELIPFSKRKEILVDVFEKLPEYLQNDAQIAIFTPLYGDIDINEYKLEEVINSSITITFKLLSYNFKLFTTKLPDTNVDVYFIHNESYFASTNKMNNESQPLEFIAKRDVVFSRAVFEYAKHLNFKADIIHSQDCHTALIPILLHHTYKDDDFWKNTKSVFEISDINNQYNCDANILNFINIKPEIIHDSFDLKSYQTINWMKAAINFADRIVVKSPTYAKEIEMQMFSGGLNDIFAKNRDKLVGILNGIDSNIFNPKTDTYLAKNYDNNSIENKEYNKKSVCELFGLEYNPNRPLISFISRLEDNKGLDLIIYAVNELQELEADFIFMGTGYLNYESILSNISTNSKNIKFKSLYVEELNSLIYAGSDFLLRPSMISSYGIGQLIALRYGTLPIVRATGCLEDTVVDYTQTNSTGFKFSAYSPQDMIQTIRYALEVYKDKEIFNKMRQNAMQVDSSIQNRIKKYLELYQNLLK